MALWVHGLGRPDALPQCTILYYNELLSVMLFGAFLICLKPILPVAIRNK